MRLLALLALAASLAGCSKQAQQNAAADASATAAELNATAAKADSDVKAATDQGAEVSATPADRTDKTDGNAIELPGSQPDETTNTL